MPKAREKEMNEVAFVLKRFGDEQSTLLDQFERLSFEVQLNQAILGRSLSEPGASRSYLQAPLNGHTPMPTAAQARQGRRRRGLGFRKVLKKWFRPIFGGKAKNDGTANSKEPDFKDPASWKAFTRSLRI